MFGLTKREQYWAAQERGIAMAIDLAKTVALAEAAKPVPQMTEEDIRRIVREELRAIDGSAHG